MKKYIFLFAIVIIILTSISYWYLNYRYTENNVKAFNKEYESLYENTINGLSLVSTINKVIDKNEYNNVKKDNNGLYLDNGVNSIIVEIKFIDSDNIFRIEQLYNNNLQRFIDLYSTRMFKCTSIKYHNDSKLVSYMFFYEI